MANSWSRAVRYQERAAVALGRSEPNLHLFRTVANDRYFDVPKEQPYSGHFFGALRNLLINDRFKPDFLSQLRILTE